MADRVSAEDRSDIEASLAGDGEAYARIVGRYQADIARQMWRFTRDRLVLEDLMQEVFVQAYSSLSRFRGEAPLLHWLRRIASCVGYAHWKREARERGRREALAREAMPPVHDPSAAAPSEAAEYACGLLAGLAPKDRLVLTLMYFEECSVKEIAARMGWSQSLVKVRAYRARRRLKHILEESGYGAEQRA